MYGKALKQGGPIEVPLFLVTVPSDVPLVAQVQERGWLPYASGTVEDPAAELRIMPEHIILSVAGQNVLEDHGGDTVSPPGWWEAVSALGDRALVALLPHDVPLNTPRAAHAVAALIDSPDPATAVVKVVHS